MQKSIKEYFREIWGYGLSHKEKMQLPIHRFISKIMIPCYLLQKLFYTLASLCRDRRLDSEIKKLFRKNDKKVASYQCALKVAKKQKNKAKKTQEEFEEVLKDISELAKNKEFEKIQEICRKYLKDL